MFAAPFRWILIGLNAYESDKTNIFPTHFENIDILVDSEVLIVREIKNSTYTIDYSKNVYLYLHKIIQTKGVDYFIPITSFITVYKIGQESSWKIEPYGVWDVTNRFQRNKEFHKITSSRRRNLENYEIRICYVLTDPDSINHLTDEV